MNANVNARVSVRLILRHIRRHPSLGEFHSRTKIWQEVVIFVSAFQYSISVSVKGVICIFVCCLVTHVMDKCDVCVN